MQLAAAMVRVVGPLCTLALCAASIRVNLSVGVRLSEQSPDNTLHTFISPQNVIAKKNRKETELN